MKTVNVEELIQRLSHVQGKPRIVTSGNLAVPWEGVEALDKALPEYTIHALNGPPGFSERMGVTVETCFVGSGQRKHPGLRYIPSRLSMVPVLFWRNLAPDVVLLHTSTPYDGHVSMGIEVNILPAAIEACRARGGIVIACMNPKMPYTFGDALVPVEAINYGIEIDTPLMEAKPMRGDDASKNIGERVASMVPDGSTLQMGIGAVPDALLSAITERKDLRFWTEMFSDGILTLDEHGALDPDYPITTSFAFGSQRLYQWLHRNPRVRMKRTETTNDPTLIARQRNMRSVNTALEVDLFGQANASRIKQRIFSGFGGQTDFIVGSLHSPGGLSFIALRSWHPKADVSTVVPLVDEPVTSFQQSMIVTEHGAAQIWGNDERTQAVQMIENCAHPSVRDHLREEGQRLGLL